MKKLFLPSRILIGMSFLLWCVTKLCCIWRQFAPLYLKGKELCSGRRILCFIFTLEPLPYQNYVVQRWFPLFIKSTNTGVASSMSEITNGISYSLRPRKGQTLVYKTIREGSKIHTDITVLLTKKIILQWIFCAIVNIPLKLGKGYQQIPNESSHLQTYASSLSPLCNNSPPASFWLGSVFSARMSPFLVCCFLGC